MIELMNGRDNRAYTYVTKTMDGTSAEGNRSPSIRLVSEGDRATISFIHGFARARRREDIRAK